MFSWFKKFLKPTRPKVLTYTLSQISEVGFRTTYELDICVDKESVRKHSFKSKPSKQVINTIIETEEERHNARCIHRS